MATRTLPVLDSPGTRAENAPLDFVLSLVKPEDSPTRAGFPAGRYQPLHAECSPHVSENLDQWSRSHSELTIDIEDTKKPQRDPLRLKHIV